MKMTLYKKLTEFNWKLNTYFSRTRQITTSSFPLQFKISPLLLAQPLKPKKKIDPAIIRQRIEKRKRKMEKQLRQLEKLGKALKPVIENEVPNVLINQTDQRKRDVKVIEDINWERTRVLKEWSRYKLREALSDKRAIKRIMSAQTQALNELKLESEELYQAAVKIDENLIPFKFTGPVETPAIKGFDPPDGDYEDISKKWI